MKIPLIPPLHPPRQHIICMHIVLIEMLAKYLWYILLNAIEMQTIFWYIYKYIYIQYFFAPCLADNFIYLHMLIQFQFLIFHSLFEGLEYE